MLTTDEEYDVPSQRELLPSRVTLHDGEALDSFLERLACANGLQSRQLLQVLRTLPGPRIPTTAFLMFKADPEFLSRVTRVSGVESRALTGATLARFGGGMPLDLEKLDPHEQTSFRQVAMQGWMPQFGSQTCPECVAQEGYWRLAWRLPLVATCVHHSVLLTPRCAGCGKRFRVHRYATLRPILGSSEPCGNSLGLRSHCMHSVTAHRSAPADPGVLIAARAIQQAMAGDPIDMLGGKTEPRGYLAELRNVATLLLHVFSRPGGESTADWGEELHREAVARTTPCRGPRWGITPPGSAAARGGALGEAHHILSQNSLEAAGNRLARWLWLVDDPNGPALWLRQRTTRTAVTAGLIAAAVAPRHHVGRRLRSLTGAESLLLPIAAVPQLIDASLYRERLEGMLGCLEWTGRMYVSLCVARLVSSATNWADAAAALDLDPGIGQRTARAASNRMRVSPAVFEEAVRHAHGALPRDRDFRARERRVRALAAATTIWQDDWRDTAVPRRRPVSLPYAVTWMWCEVALGPLGASPAWAAGPTRTARAAYRVFRDKLPEPSKGFLRALVLAGAPSGAAEIVPPPRVYSGPHR